MGLPWAEPRSHVPRRDCHTPSFSRMATEITLLSEIRFPDCRENSTDILEGLRVGIFQAGKTYLPKL